MGCQGEKEVQISLKVHLDMEDSNVCHDRSLVRLLLHKFVYKYPKKNHHLKYLRTLSLGEEPSHQSVGENCKLALCFTISSALKAPVSSWV